MKASQILEAVSTLKKYLFALAIAAGAVVYEIPDTGHINWRATALVGAKAGLTALGVAHAATSSSVHQAVAAVTEK